jgi:hypothetical protein
MHRKVPGDTLWTPPGETFNPLVEGSNPSWLAALAALAAPVKSQGQGAQMSSDRSVLVAP